jgi:hypothetical protein
LYIERNYMNSIFSFENMSFFFNTDYGTNDDEDINPICCVDAVDITEVSDVTHCEYDDKYGVENQDIERLYFDSDDIATKVEARLEYEFEDLGESEDGTYESEYRTYDSEDGTDDSEDGTDDSEDGTDDSEDRTDDSEDRTDDSEDGTDDDMKFTIKIEIDQHQNHFTVLNFLLLINAVVILFARYNYTFNSHYTNCSQFDGIMSSELVHSKREFILI